MTPEQLRDLADIADGQGIMADGDIYRAHAAALEELARLRARLEIDFATDGNGKRVPFPTGGPDGIACRDETIRILESALAEAERKCARLRFHAKKMNDWIQSHYTGPEPLCSINYRAEFKE